MSNELTLRNLLPSVTNTQIVRDKLRGSTFIGIDFGTSTTVVSYTVFGDESSPIKTDVMPIRQLNVDGSYTEDHLVPSCIAWYDNKLFIGRTAKQLKSKLIYGRNIWYSFKMKIGTDNGPMYYGTELPTGHQQATIENPLDATKLFFNYLKSEIDYFINKNNLPTTSYYSISIPASFESNQRNDLKEALSFAGIPFQESLFIDEPNAAFLSYLIEANSNNIKNYNIPLDSPLHILVFDFGAGTCDISILEIGRKTGRLYSKNIAISKFEQLGGDDIDKLIVKEILFPQLLLQNSLETDDIKSPEYKKIIIPKLQPIAEHLKIQISKKLASNMVGHELPSLARSDKSITVEQSFHILLPKHQLNYSNPTLSFAQFSGLMEKFLNENSKYDSTHDEESVKSIFTVINSALLKGNLEKNDINLVLLIGGSSYNPYVQTALRKHFAQSQTEIPRNLQAHVSIGAAVNSFLQNGMNIDMIKPIVSEPIFIILQNDTQKILVHEGTEIPCSGITIEGIHPQSNNQKTIEIPICVSSKDKILTIIKIESSKGFDVTDRIKIECEISHDKLLHFRAFIRELEVQAEPLNPFANAALNTEEIAEKKLLKALNMASRNNNGKPPIKLLIELARFYAKIEKHLKAAETFETIHTLNPALGYESSICYHYACAEKKKLSDKWAEKAFKNNPNGTNSYNLALVYQANGDLVKYAELMEIAVSENLNMANLVYGSFIQSSDKAKGTALIHKAFDHWYDKFQSNTLENNHYKSLIKAARLLKKSDIEKEVKSSMDKLKDKESVKWYDENNLASDSGNYLPQTTE